MPRKGENIYKRKDNRWEARFLKGHAPDGTPRYGYCYAKTYREVKQKVTAARLSLASKPQGASPSRTICDYSDQWLALIQPSVAQSTLVKYNSILNRYILPEFGTTPLTEVNTVAIGIFTRKLQEQHCLSPKTIRDILSIIKTLLRFIAAQPQERLMLPELYYPKTAKQEIRVLSREEQDRFIRYLLQDTDPGKIGVLLALTTGMRIGEVCALRWRDIIASDDCICVNATMQRIQDLDPDSKTKTRIVISDPKTENSRRTIPMNTFTAGLCRRFRPADPMAYVLTGDPIRYMEPRTLQYRLKKYADECEIEGLHFHTLRHTFATRCVESGFEIKSLSEVLGHSNSRTTLDLYVHPSMELKRSNMEKLSFYQQDTPSETAVSP